MSHLILNNGDTGLVFRTKLNDNFADINKESTSKVVLARVTPKDESITTTATTIPIAELEIYSKNITYNLTTGVYSNVYAGLYKYDFFMLGNWGNGIDLHLSAWVDGVQLGTDVTYTGAGSAKNVAMSIPYYLILTANQDVEIKIHADSTTTLEIVNASIGLSLSVLAEHI